MQLVPTTPNRNLHAEDDNMDSTPIRSSSETIDDSLTGAGGDAMEIITILDQVSRMTLEGEEGETLEHTPKLSPSCKSPTEPALVFETPRNRKRTLSFVVAPRRSSHRWDVESSTSLTTKDYCYNMDHATQQYQQNQPPSQNQPLQYGQQPSYLTSRAPPPLLPNSPELDGDYTKGNPYERHQPLYSPFSRVSQLNMDYIMSNFYHPEDTGEASTCCNQSKKVEEVGGVAIGNACRNDIPKLNLTSRPYSSVAFGSSDDDDDDDEMTSSSLPYLDDPDDHHYDAAMIHHMATTTTTSPFSTRATLQMRPREEENNGNGTSPTTTNNHSTTNRPSYSLPYLYY